MLFIIEVCVVPPRLIPLQKSVTTQFLIVFLDLVYNNQTPVSRQGRSQPFPSTVCPSQSKIIPSAPITIPFPEQLLKSQVKVVSVVIVSPQAGQYALTRSLNPKVNIVINPTTIISLHKIL